MARVLAHAHSDWSYDGTMSLERWRDLARQSGYDAVLFAEHEETGWDAERYARYVAACASASAPDVALIPGIEFNQQGFHIACYGLRRWPSRPGSIEDLAAAVHDQGCLLCLAHPPRYRWRYPAALLRAVDAVEVWNSIWCCDGTLGPHPKSLSLARGKRIVVGQDVHKSKHVSGVHIVTESSDVVADLAARRYVLARGSRLWTPDEMRRMRLLPLLQLARTPLLRTAIKSYRWMRLTLIERAPPRKAKPQNPEISTVADQIVP
jgi:hypothetical protein